MFRIVKYILIVLAVSLLISGVTAKTVKSNQIRFVTIGDPHLVNNTNADQDQRLVKIVNYVNNRSDVDFVVVLGDETNGGTNKEFNITKNILKKLKKPYYTIAGNHDIIRGNSSYLSYFGPMQSTIVKNGYQLLFVGMWEDNTTSFHWSFNFNKANKNMPTLVFVHGAVKGAPPDCHCTWGNFFRYAAGMQPELDKFKKLIGVYSGHVHYDSDQVFNGTPYITMNGLINTTLMHVRTPVPENPSNYIGYTIVSNNVLNYSLVPYQ